MNYEQAYLETMMKVIKTQEELIVLLREEISRLKLAQTVTIGSGSTITPNLSPAFIPYTQPYPGGISPTISPITSPGWYVTGDGGGASTLTGEVNISTTGYVDANPHTSLCGAGGTSGNIDPSITAHIRANAR